MDSYRIQLFAHITVAVVGLGATFAYPFLQGFAERNGVGAARFSLRFMNRLENILVIPGAILVFLFGLGLMFNEYTSFGGVSEEFPTWLGIAMAWYVAAFLVAVLVQRRNVLDAIRMLEGVPDGGHFPPSYRDVSRRIQMVGGLLGVSVIGIAFMMVWGTEGGF
ncbi:MAG: DUF2269 family protein [Dehalococcoidia bacterium]|nr:DUF2269 family protein [Dehalococcoidia bacterium]